MFRDPVLRRTVDDGEEHSRGERKPPGHQGEPTPAAYHRSPTQAGQPYQHHSPNTPAPLPLHQNLHHPHPHPHPPQHSPNTTELPPISTALYSRDTSRYYDPTSDNGERGVARDPARYDSTTNTQYPAQVRLSSLRPPSSLLYIASSSPSWLHPQHRDTRLTSTLP